MSSSTYASYRVSERERRRIERERQARLAEEQQRREEEIRRQREAERLRRIAEEKERAKAGFRLQRQAAKERLQELLQRISKRANLPNREALLTECAEIAKRLDLAEHPEVGALARRIGVLQAQLPELDRQPNRQGLVGGPVLSMLDETKALLAGLPEHVQQMHATEIDRIKKTLRTVEEAEDPVCHGLSLKWARRDLKGFLAKAERDRQTLESKETEIIGLIARCQTILSSPQLVDELKSQARTLESVLSSLLGVTDLDELERQLAGPRNILEGLFQKLEAAQLRAAEREFALGVVEDVLTSMGYVPIPSGSPASVDSEIRASLQYLTPNREAVRLELGPDNSLHAEFMHARFPDQGPANKVDLVHHCRTWCQDYEALIREAKQKGLALSESPTSRRPPELGTFVELPISPELAESLTEEQIRARVDQVEARRRTM